MPTEQTSPATTAPPTGQSSEETLFESSPMSGSVPQDLAVRSTASETAARVRDTQLPAGAETLIEPITAGVSSAAASSAERTPVSTGRWGTAPVAEQETLVEAQGGTGGPRGVGGKQRQKFDIPHLLGDYELLEELGRGGMGIVYRAKQRSVNRVVALKVIRPDRLASMTHATKQKTIERFRNEAEAAARITHDNLVTVYEVGCEAGCHFFSMRYVEGSSLSDKTRKNPADNREAAKWIEPVCRAVDAVHRNGILHRDLKPQNIMFEDSTAARCSLTSVLRNSPTTTRA